MDALEAIRTRRVVRSLSTEPVAHDQLATILQCARWAPVGANVRIHEFVAVEDARLLRLLRAVSPGMFQRPTAAIVICSEWGKLIEHGFPDADLAPRIDLGTVMQTMLLAAHAQGLGSGPVTSFCKASVREILQLPDRLSPEVIVCLGHPGEGSQLPMRGGSRVTWESLVTWNRFDGKS